MKCSRKDCLAAYEWFGSPDDPALVKIATERGWRLFERQGWICPHHAKVSPT